MNSGRDDTAVSFGIEKELAPPAAPFAMPEQTIERKRRARGFFSFFALRLFAAK